MFNLKKMGKFALVFAVSLFFLNIAERQTGHFSTDLVGWYVKCIEGLLITVLIFLTLIK